MANNDDENDDILNDAIQSSLAKDLATMGKLATKKSGGAKTSRSETVTVRLEPQVRYLAELAGRKQRRTLSSFIEWAIQKGLESVPLDYQNGGTSIADMAAQLWDVDDADRFVKLAINYPDLLTHDEQVLWKIVRENGWLWKGSYKNSMNEWRWDIKEEDFVFNRFRDNWDLFLKVAKKEEDKSSLPTWPKINPNLKPKPDFSDMDDNIPF